MKVCMEGGTMKEKRYRWLKGILIFILLFSLGMYGLHLVRMKESRDIYEQAAELATEEVEETTKAPVVVIEETTEPETAAEEPDLFTWREAPAETDFYMEELAKKDLVALREVNPDVLGWILIPETPVDYPLMDGEDNDYYLSHTWDKKDSSAGSICLEMLNNPDLRDFNTLIYGHRMMNESMFGSLKHYDTQKYFDEHPYVYLLDDSGVHRYEIFSAYTAPVDSYTFIYGFRNEESMEKFLKYCMGQSVVKTGVEPTVDDKILTLVTCTGRGYEARFVVQARLKGVEGNPHRLYGVEETKPEK